MLFHQEPVYKNISISVLDRISALLLKPTRERAIAKRQVEQLPIRPPLVGLDLGMRSGGNQQKVALAKWLSYPPRLLVLCEPTRGMDVGAKNDVINIVRDLRAKGLAIIVLSTEPETVLSLADRILVLKRGAVVREFANEAVSKDRLLEAAWRRSTMARRETVAAAERKPRGIAAFLRSQMRNIAPFLTLIFLSVFFAAASPSFATLDNVGNILTQVSVTGIIAVGLPFVILCAEIDLSIASIANVTGIAVAYFTLQESYVNIANVPLPGLAAITLALLLCAFLGLVNALGLTVIGIPSFIM